MQITCGLPENPSPPPVTPSGKFLINVDFSAFLSARIGFRMESGGGDWADHLHAVVGRWSRNPDGPTTGLHPRRSVRPHPWPGEYAIDFYTEMRSPFLLRTAIHSNAGIVYDTPAGRAADHP